MKTYLDQEFSPNLQIRQHYYDFGRYCDAEDTTELLIAGIGSNCKKECSPELAKLLLEYEAGVEMKNGLFRSPLNKSIRLFHGSIKSLAEYAFFFC